MTSRNVLIAGESWIMHTIHQKGFDSFTTTAYGEGHQWLAAGLTAGGWNVEHLPNHLANEKFPASVADMDRYDLIILSDIGANTLLLHPDTFVKSAVLPNRLQELSDYVSLGGGLIMIGGYLTFQGIEAKGNYAGSPIEAALPVTLQTSDDRVETPQGVQPAVTAPDHEIATGLPLEWPVLLGYNRLTPREDATVVAMVGDDPLIAAWSFGKGRSVA
ncbi:MAG: cytoplasmic protein, partial [Thermomicrobiales bacterium]|nr:cytoplasmic protein [Thermomicrobiales bacterium]